MSITKKIKPVKVAIIGCGSFGNYHLNNLLKIENVEVVALYNKSVEKLQKTGEKVPKARLYQDLDKMMVKENIDAVIVCVTPDAHGQIEDLCCKKGIHMFVEKPVELSLENATKYSEQIKLANIITSVGYHERYSPVIETVKEILKTEPVGIVNAHWIGSLPSAPWWRVKAQSGGQIVEQSTHLVDLLRYLFGEVDSIFMSGGRNESFDGLEHDVEDYSSGIMHFKSGVMATLQSACYIKEGGVGKIGFEIITPRCIIEYKWGKSLTVTTKEQTKELNIVKDNHVPCLETFIEAVRTGDSYLIKSTYEDAIKSLEVTLKANVSIESQELVKI